MEANAVVAIFWVFCLEDKKKTQATQNVVQELA